MKEVVILDDEQYFVNSMVSFIEEDDIKVFGYSQPSKLLDDVDKFSKDALIYLDMYMPQYTGAEVAEKLHKLGFKRLYLMSGLDKDFIEEEIPSIIEDVIVKGPSLIDHVVDQISNESISKKGI